jgi:hypothetical protein
MQRRRWSSTLHPIARVRSAARTRSPASLEGTDRPVFGDRSCATPREGPKSGQTSGRKSPRPGGRRARGSRGTSRPMRKHAALCTLSASMARRREPGLGDRCAPATHGHRPRPARIPKATVRPSGPRGNCAGRRPSLQSPVTPEPCDARGSLLCLLSKCQDRVAKPPASFFLFHLSHS